MNYQAPKIERIVSMQSQPQEAMLALASAG